MRRKLSKTRHQQRGAVAVVVAIALIPLILAAGIGIDYLRAMLAREELQAAVDAAALTASAGGAVTTEAEMHKKANDFLRNARGTFKLKTVTPAHRDDAASTLSFGATATIETTFMRIAGLKTMEISANSLTQIPRLGPVELALVLDITWSMDATPMGGTEKKITTLKSAATGLVNKLMTSENVAIGIVPFTTWINIGTSFNGQSWLNVPPDKTVEAPRLIGCFPTGQICTRDGNQAPCIKCEWDYTKKVNVNYRFNGTVGLRPSPYQETRDSPGVQFNGSTQPAVAPAIMDLTKKNTSNNTGLAAVRSKIAALNPTNHEYVWNTFIPGGLIWGWNMLTSEMPLNRAVTEEKAKEVGLRKVLLMMTDGDNNVEIDSTGLKFTRVDDASVTNAMTSNICENIKQDGILIYTVGFSVTSSSTKAMLEKCASPGSYFDAENSEELLRAFEDIHTSLLRVRLLE